MGKKGIQIYLFHWTIWSNAQKGIQTILVTRLLLNGGKTFLLFRKKINEVISIILLSK